MDHLSPLFEALGEGGEHKGDLVAPDLVGTKRMSGRGRGGMGARILSLFFLRLR
jgi:hypothetical protein